MKPESLRAPNGSAPWMVQFVQQLVTVLRAMTGGTYPLKPHTVADNASAPDAGDWSGHVVLSEDADGLGNPGWIYSDGFVWTAL